MLGNVQHRVVDTKLAQNFVGRFLDDACAWVEVLVDTVSEAHEAEAVCFVFGPVDPRLERAAFGANGFKHLNDRLVGTTMKWTPEGRHAGRDRAVQVGLRRSHHADGGRGTVLLVVGVQNEQLVQRRFHDGVDFVVFRRNPPHHVHEVADVAQVVLGVHRGQPHVVLVGLCSQGGQLRDQPVDGQIDVRDVTVGILRFGVERRQGRHHAAQHAHGVGPKWKRVEEALHVLVHNGVARDAVVEVLELFLVGEVAVNQQVGHFDEGGFLSQLFNGVASVAQHAILAIEVRDAALGGARVFKTGVHGDVPSAATQFGDVDRFLVFRAGDDRELVFLAIQDHACSFAHGNVV